MKMKKKTHVDEAASGALREDELSQAAGAGTQATLVAQLGPHGMYEARTSRGTWRTVVSRHADGTLSSTTVGPIGYRSTDTAG